MKVIGVVGQIAAGKTTVTKMLEKSLKAYIINADQVGHRILKKGQEAFKPVVETFGEKNLGKDGEIDRKKLGKLVFSDPAKLSQLNQISHPLIYKSIKEEIARVRLGGKYDFLVVEAALLAQTKLLELVDELWGVYIPRDEQIRRVMKRNQISSKEAEQRISCQPSWESIEKHIDVKIDNSKNLDYTRKQIEENASKS